MQCYCHVLMFVLLVTFVIVYVLQNRGSEVTKSLASMIFEHFVNHKNLVKNDFALVFKASTNLYY